MAHEDLTREQHLEGSSDRNFGFVIASAFAVIAILPFFHRETPRWWAFCVAAVVVLVAILKPALLGGMNRLWVKLGVLLGKVISPVVLSVLFYCVLTPVGALMRLTGKDALRLKRDAGVKSYWIPREPPGPPPDSMTNQF